MTSNFKCCVRYLNRYTISPTYLLYQLNEKNELTITYHTFFYLKYYHFWKRGLPAIHVLSTSHFVFMKFTTGKLRQASFQPAFTLCDILECPNQSRFQLQNYYQLYWKMKSSQQVYFINVRLFSRIFCKPKYFQNLLQGGTFKILYFQLRSGPC